MPLQAKDIMSVNVVSVSPETSIAEASRLMLEHRFNGLPVVDAQGTLLGILCQSDLIVQHKKFKVPSFFFLLDGFIPLQSPHKTEEQLERMAAATVGQAMTRNPRVIAPDTPLRDIADLMVDDKYHTLPVVEQGRLVGVVGKEDVLKTLIDG